MTLSQSALSERNAARTKTVDDLENEAIAGSKKTLTMTAGDIGLRIPKLRKGSFFPSILEPRRRTEKTLHAVVMEAYVNGVSTRAVDDLVTAMGSTAGISKSEVRRICAEPDATVEGFRSPGHPASHAIMALCSQCPQPESQWSRWMALSLRQGYAARGVAGALRPWAQL